MSDMREAEAAPRRELQIATPPGWPSVLPAPGRPGWSERAVSWLLEQAAPGWRNHEDFFRAHPALLARLVRHTVHAQLEELRRGYSTARVDLRGAAEPHTLAELLAVYAAEGERTKELGRAVQLVTDALAGIRWRPGS
jgi:hypothetical protein